MKTFVLIPTYNEIENIESIIKRVFLNLPDSSILVIDDNSSDGTREMVKNHTLFNKNIFILEREKKKDLAKLIFMLSDTCWRIFNQNLLQ